MPLDLFAGIPVRDYAVGREWYERLLGSEPTFVAHETEAVWDLAEHRSVYVVQDPERAGHALVMLFVDDLEGRLAAVSGRGIEPHRRETYGNGVRKHLPRPGRQRGEFRRCSAGRRRHGLSPHEAPPRASVPNGPLGATRVDGYALSQRAYRIEILAVGGPRAGLRRRGARNGLDPRALVALARHESVLGTEGSGAGINDAFGWGPAIAFLSWEDAIGTVAGGLATNYVGRGRWMSHVHASGKLEARLFIPGPMGAVLVGEGGNESGNARRRPRIAAVKRQLGAGAAEW